MIKQLGLPKGPASNKPLQKYSAYGLSEGALRSSLNASLFWHGASEEGANPTQKISIPHFSNYHEVTKMGFHKILSVRPPENLTFLILCTGKSDDKNSNVLA